MEEIYRSNAWEIAICEEVFVTLGERAIKVIDRKTKKTIKTRRHQWEYYNSLCVCLEEGIIAVVCTEKNKVDILSIETLELVTTIKWEGKRSYRREEMVFDQEEQCFYCNLYAFIENRTIITKISAKDLRENIFKEIQDYFACDFICAPNVNDYLLKGVRFTHKKGIFSTVSVEEEVWLKREKERITFEEKNKRIRRAISHIAVLNDDNIVYSAKLHKTNIFISGKRKAIAKLKADLIAFSDNGKFFAFISKKILYIHSCENNECIDQIALKVKSRFATIFRLAFQQNDEYISYRDGDELVLYKLKD